jgi:hypothetical protein
MEALAIIEFSIWVYDIVKQKSRQFLLNCYYAFVWSRFSFASNYKEGDQYEYQLS